MKMAHLEWAIQYLKNRGYELTNESPDIIQNTPWSEVSRIETTVGYLYLKKTPPLIAHEPIIIQTLHEQCHAPVPEIVAYNIDLNCFLMKDAGEHLRPTLKNNFDVDLACNAIQVFANFQISTANHLQALIAVGVPDWRLEKFPRLYRELLLQRHVLKEDGLSENEIIEFENLVSVVDELSKDAVAYGVQQTIVQPDFNDNNSLIDKKSQKTTIIDLGEIVIAHPFFSMYNWLQIMQKYHGITTNNTAYKVMLNAYLQCFDATIHPEKLIEAFDQIRPLCHVYAALACFRLIEACGSDERMVLQRGKLSDALRQFAVAIH